jgi:hypothetical protein
MNARYLAVTALAALFALAASAQPGADLLQKGTYAQETMGDLDGAIKIYRQITSTAGVSKPIAAQAQYQLVLSMLQKGDRVAAARELDLLARNYPDQQDLINKARKLIPGGSTLLAPAWADGDASQLNIKRDGRFTGEYLYYAATPFARTLGPLARDVSRYSSDQRLRFEAQMRQVYLSCWLKTKTSNRGIFATVDRDDMHHLDTTRFSTDDLAGDASAAPFAGPAIDAEPLVFRMRMLPLTAGYKATLTTLPFLVGYGSPKSVELAVTGVEAIETVAGKFNCYKVSFASLGQTFWIGVDGARPLVKFQSGNVEAELVHFWAPAVFDEAVAFIGKAGWTVQNVRTDTGSFGSLPWGVANISNAPGSPYGDIGVMVSMRRSYIPVAEIDQELRDHCSGSGVKKETVQARKIGGYAAISCTDGDKFHIWVRTEGLGLEFAPTGDQAIFRWLFEPVLEGIKLPKD